MVGFTSRNIQRKIRNLEINVTPPDIRPITNYKLLILQAALKRKKPAKETRQRQTSLISDKLAFTPANL